MAWLVSDGRVLASADIADARNERRRGLLGRNGYDGALVLKPCRWIHTVGLRFPIDVAYIDEGGNVLRTVRMKSFRVGMPQPRASFVVEAQAGAFGRWGLNVGDVVELRD